MKVMSRGDVLDLAAHRGACSVSLYMPTYRAGRAKQQNSIRLKNLTKKAGELLQKSGCAMVADAVLEPLAKLQLNVDYWRHCADGFACFCAPGLFRAHRIPIQFEERVHVNDHFHLEPLLPLLAWEARLFVLALSKDTARLYETTPYSIREIVLPYLMKEGAGDREKTLRHHSHHAGQGAPGAFATAVYHGQGGAADRKEVDTERFFREVDRAITEALAGQRSPLLLACVGYLAAIYRTVNSYPQLIREKVPGSPDSWSDGELLRHAWKVAAPRIREHELAAWKEFETARGIDRATDDIERIVLAAANGRVDALFVESGARLSGKIDDAKQAVYVSDNDQTDKDLIDDAAINTLTNGGDVHSFASLPGTESPLAAILRY